MSCQNGKASWGRLRPTWSIRPVAWEFTCSPRSMIVGDVRCVPNASSTELYAGRVMRSVTDAPDSAAPGPLISKRNWLASAARSTRAAAWSGVAVFGEGSAGTGPISLPGPLFQPFPHR